MKPDDRSRPQSVEALLGERGERVFLDLQLEQVEFRFDRAGIQVRAQVAEDVRTGRSWMRILRDDGPLEEEIVRIIHNHRYVDGVDAWTLMDPDTYQNLSGPDFHRLTFAETVALAIEEVKKQG